MDKVATEQTTAQTVHARMLEYAADDDARAQRQWATGDTLGAAQLKGRAEGYRLAADMMATRGLLS